MPYEVIKYRCSKCHNEYVEVFQAMDCENLPTSTLGDHINEGDELSFQMENGGVRWSYGMETGKVLYKMLSRQNDLHVWVFIVDIKYCERGVIFATDDEGGVGAFSPAEFAYNSGFAQFMKSKTPTL